MRATIDVVVTLKFVMDVERDEPARIIKELAEKWAKELVESGITTTVSGAFNAAQQSRDLYVKAEDVRAGTPFREFD